MTRNTEIDAAAVLAQLEKVLASDAFQGATRSTTLLRFLVDEVVKGRIDRLKEYTLGAEGLGKGEAFDRAPTRSSAQKRPGCEAVWSATTVVRDATTRC